MTRPSTTTQTSKSVPSAGTKCFVCGAPWHPASGGLHDNGLGGLTAFCGACERDLVKWVVNHIKSVKKKVKVDGKVVILKFYDYAHPPVDEKEQK
jgi:hypothetical protein